MYVYMMYTHTVYICNFTQDVAVTTVLSGGLAQHQEPYLTFFNVAKLINVLIPLQGVFTLTI